MAKKKRKVSRRRRSRVGAAGSPIATLLAMSAGNIAGRVAASKITTLSPTIMAAAQAITGFLLTRMASPMIKGLGAGLVVNGVAMATQSFGLISGIGQPHSFRHREMDRNVSPLITGGDPFIDARDGINYDGVGDVDHPEVDLISGVFDDYS